MSSKALVIKDVNFSANKLTTVTLIDPIPCTGLTLNKSTKAMGKMLSTETLVATPTPSNTTDVISWTSSNETVATVDSSGVVTQVGIGTCTITATCGTQTATCTITATASYTNADFSVIHGNGIQIAAGEGNDYLSTYRSTAQRSYMAIGNPLDGYRSVTGASDYNDYYPIPLPQNAVSLTITVSGDTQVFISAFFYFVDTRQPSTAGTFVDAQRGAKCYGSGGGVFSTGSKTKTISLASIDSHVNAFTLRMGVASGNVESEFTNTITIEFA